MSSPNTWPPAPDALPVPVTDNHTHFGFESERTAEPVRSVAEQIDAARAVGVTQFIDIGCDLDSARATVQRTQEYPQILGGVALHPTEAAKLDSWQDAFEVIADLATSPRIRVIGETGMDTHWTGPEGMPAQRESFRAHIALAKELNKPLQIHDRNAHREILDILRSDGAPEKTVFHCYSGDREMAQILVENGWYMSIAGTVTFKNAQDLHEAVAWAPVESLLVETDAPYLTPAPYRGRVNAPYLMPLTVGAIAQLKDLSLEQVCSSIQENTQAIYGQW